MRFFKANSGVGAKLLWQGFARAVDCENIPNSAYMEAPALVTVVHITGCDKPIDVVSMLTVDEKNKRRKFARSCLYGRIRSLEDGFLIKTHDEEIRFVSADDELSAKEKLQLASFTLISNMYVTVDRAGIENHEKVGRLDDENN